MASCDCLGNNSGDIGGCQLLGGLNWLVVAGWKGALVGQVGLYFSVRGGFWMVLGVLCSWYLVWDFERVWNVPGPAISTSTSAAAAASSSGVRNGVSIARFVREVAPGFFCGIIM